MSLNTLDINLNKSFFNFFLKNLSFEKVSDTYIQMVRFVDCWFNRLLNILEGYGGLTTLVHISNKIQKETENLSLRYDELGVGT